MFNYTSVKADVSIENNVLSSCDCETLKFQYGPYSHVINGNLNTFEERAVVNFLKSNHNIVLR